VATAQTVAKIATMKRQRMSEKAVFPIPGCLLTKKARIPHMGTRVRISKIRRTVKKVPGHMVAVFGGRFY